MSRPAILVIEDEADLREVLRYNLDREGFRVLTESDGQAGLARARRQRPDLILLDLMLPDMDGLEICRRIRADADLQGVPIIMVTAKDAEPDIVLGLGIGADDYITKPFGVAELIARVKAVMRRRMPSEVDDAPPAIQRGVLRIDPARHEVRLADVPVEMTATEFRLLRMMALRPGRVYARIQLLRDAMGDDSHLGERNVDVHIRAIRSKLGDHRDLIETVRGVGYRFRDAGT